MLWRSPCVRSNRPQLKVSWSSYGDIDGIITVMDSEAIIKAINTLYGYTLEKQHACAFPMGPANTSGDDTMSTLWAPGYA